MTRTRRDHLHLHCIVLIWGATAILGQLISLPSVEVVFYRTLIATFGPYLVIKVVRKDVKVNVRKDY